MKGFIAYYDEERATGVVMDVFFHKYYFFNKSVKFSLEEIENDLPVTFDVLENKKGKIVARNIQKCI